MFDLSNLRTWTEINLNNIEYNFKNIKKHIANTKIMSVVKADAYGHGAVEVAKILDDAGTDYFAVACINEALELRNNGINKPILVLGYIQDDKISEAIENDVTFTVFSYEYAERISNIATEQNSVAKIHIKIDTGMGRIGFLYGYNDEDDSETIKSIKRISDLDSLDIEGIFTHFSSSDESDVTKTELQFKRFLSVIESLKKIGIEFKLRHCCNSDGIIRFKDMYLDMVRPGIILYGCYPSEICNDGTISLKPVMSLKTNIIHIKSVNKNFGISYGETYFTDKITKIATLPIGYADGLLRLNSNKLLVSVNGQPVKIIGRICMDQCMIDVTNVNNISVGSFVTVFGYDDELPIPVENLSELCGTISYEILCNIGKRVPRIYYRKQ